MASSAGCLFGAQWHVVDISSKRAVVELCTCVGEPTERVASDDPLRPAFVVPGATPASATLIAYVNRASDLT
jgi:hypothetical protein